MNFLTAVSNPAGGAATQDIVLATGGAMVLTTFVVVTGVLYRSGKVAWLHKLADFSERQWGVPAWVALSGEIASVSLIVALLGMYWDISLHIDNGRDPGPLANPAHYLILFGLFGVFVAGFLAIIMGDHRGGSSMIKRASTWKIPIGGIMLFACASFSLLGFPLDDGWHRIFGQDVTLWGPTHLMLFGGAGMTLIGRASLLVEGQRAARREREQAANGDGAAGAKAVGIPGRRLMNLQIAGLMGGFLIGMSTFQGEFDFGVPQFQLVFHPILIAWAAGIALVTARIWGGRWSALVAVAFFLGIRGVVSIFVGPVMGEVTPHFPLYIVEAVLVEGIAYLISTRNPIRFGAVSGLAIGTIGFASEWLWSHIWMPIPWPSSLMPEGLIWAIVAGVSGGLLGALIGSALGSDRKPFPWRGAKPALAVSFVAIFAMVGFGLHVNNDAKGATAHFQLTGVDGGGSGRYVQARVTLDPRTAAGDPKWVSVTAWQGKGKLVLNRLKKLSEGVYQTTTPIPVHGDWKALLRIHKDDAILGAPIYLPNDPAIPAKEVPAKAEMTRPLISDHKILQREAKSASGVLPLFAYLGVLAIALGLCALMTWGLTRLARDGDAALPGPAPQPREAWIQRPSGAGAPTPA